MVLDFINCLLRDEVKEFEHVARQLCEIVFCVQRDHKDFNLKVHILYELQHSVDGVLHDLLFCRVCLREQKADT